MTTENPGPSGADDPWKRPEADAPVPSQPPQVQPQPPAGSWSSGYPTPETPGYGQPPTWPPAGQQWPPSNPYATGPTPPAAYPGAPSGYPQQAPTGGQFYAGQQPGQGAYGPQQPGYGPQQPGYPGGTNPYQPGFAAAPPPEKRRGGLLILLGVLAACLALVVVGVLTQPRTTTTTTTSTTGATTAPASSHAPTAVAASASDAVRGYLDALAAGDAAAALSYAELPPGDTTLLTDDVLAAGNTLSPITDIEVAPSSGTGATSVEASYTLAGQNIDTTYDVVDTAAGWKLAQSAAEIDAGQLTGFPVQLNGVALTPGNTLVLFPGSYRLTSGDDRYQLSDGDFLVESPADLPNVDATLTLTDSGRAAVRAAAKAKLATCIKANKMDPGNGCGFAVRGEDENGRAFKPKKVRWKITSGANALAKAKLAVDQNDPTTVTGTTKVKLYVRIDATNGRWYWARLSISTLSADLSGGGVSVAFNQ